MKRFPATTKKIALVLLALFASLVVAEIALRIFGFSFELYLKEVEFGWPNAKLRAERFVPDGDLLWVSQSYQRQVKVTTKAEILFLGDSTSAFGGYQSFLKRFIVPPTEGPPPRFATLAVPGWSSHQALEAFKRDGARFQPKIVSILLGWNDHWISSGIEDKDVAAVNRPLMKSIRSLRVVQLVQGARISLRKKDGPWPPNRVSRSDFRSNLVGMVRLAKRRGAEPLLITAPSSHQKGREPAFLAGRHLRNLADLTDIHREYKEVVREVSRSEGVALCDLFGQFERLPNWRDEKKRYFRDDGIHMRQEGYKQVARLLYGCLKRNKLLALIRARD